MVSWNHLFPFRGAIMVGLLQGLKMLQKKKDPNCHLIISTLGKNFIYYDVGFVTSNGVWLGEDWIQALDNLQTHGMLKGCSVKIEYN